MCSVGSNTTCLLRSYIDVIVDDFTVRHLYIDLKKPSKLGQNLIHVYE